MLVDLCSTEGIYYINKSSVKIKMFTRMLMCSDCSAMLGFLFVLSTGLNYMYAQQLLKRPTSDFTRHQVVRPLYHHGKENKEIFSTRNPDGLHKTDLTVTIPTEDGVFILDLQLNNELLTDGHKIVIREKTKHKVHTPTKEELDLCQYRGRVRGLRDSWAAVSTCHGLKGTFYDGTHMHHIENAGEYKLDSHHYLYNHKDKNSTFKCGYKDQHDPLNVNHLLKNSRLSRHKRSTENNEQIFGPFNSNELTRYVEFALVVDYLEYESNNRDLRMIHSQSKDVANIINAVYAPLNIFIALVGVVVWTSREHNREITENGDNTLSFFLKYRASELQKIVRNDNAHLLSGQKFNGSVVGKALKGTMCTYSSSGGIATNHSETVGLVAVTIAHEMGHNFGMDHDDEQDCTCPDKKCIMHAASSSNDAPTHWSSCSLKAIAFSFQRGLDYCLRNKPRSLFESPTCGNGFVEASEQCDCGPSWRDTKCSQCCNVDTCMLRENATCATGSCCNIDTCKPHSPGVKCRAEQAECDLPEYCTGHSEHCPADLHKMDATPCKNGEAYCGGGKCRSHTDQCKLLWGTTGKQAQPKCYRDNVHGNETGNCGYNLTTRQYKRCAVSDVTCGMLHCQHLNERLEFGVESVSRQQSTFINFEGSIVACRSVLLDLGLDDVDPGLVPDGAICGDHMMCYKQRCRSVESVRELYGKLQDSECPSDCSGHGVCNSLGECHCDKGFGPPLCQLPGAGGSKSSGPASDPTIHHRFMVAMYIIFLGIVPTIALCLFLYYYSRQNVLCWWMRPKKPTQSPTKNNLQRRFSRGASKFASNFSSSGPNQTIAPVNTNTNTDEMSSSLLRSEPDPTSPLGGVDFFGNFKGFSLAPIGKNSVSDINSSVSVIGDTSNGLNGSASHAESQSHNCKPVRVAPSIPVAPKSPKSNINELKRSNSGVHNKIKHLIANEKPEEPKQPALARPSISGPILNESTCSAKELISPLHTKTLAPHRSAPKAPTEDSKRPVSVNYDAPVKPLPEEPTFKKPINRIASFLKNEKGRSPVERSHSLPKNPKIKPTVVDKAALRNLQISNPILQKNIDLPVNAVPVVSNSDRNDFHPSIARTQSMRVAPLAKPEMLTYYGSMRYARPTVPPPPRPNAAINIYQNSDPDNQYDDCTSEPKVHLANIHEENSDNIYAVIEEGPSSPQKTIPCSVPDGYSVPRPVEPISGSTESVGLLGEIVSEIQNRNFESIYSTGTISRKKKEGKGDDEIDENYDRCRSDVSTTSSGYMAPSAINVPQNNEGIVKLNSTPPSPNQKGVNSKIPKFGRQVTPPSLRSVPSSPKNIPKVDKQSSTVSPDLVSSCSPNTYGTTGKSPDVVNNNANKLSTFDIESNKVAKPTTDNSKPPVKPVLEKKNNPARVVPAKPNIVPKPSLQTKPSQRNTVKVDPNVKSVLDNLNKSKPKVVPKPSSVSRSDVTAIKPSTTKVTARPSNVASLQQKFESRKSLSNDVSNIK